MQSAFWKIYSGLQRLIPREEGQDLVEYSLVILLVAVGVVAAVGTFSADLDATINHITATCFP
jgi:Flp pilus assembly pilin Flp